MLQVKTKEPLLCLVRKGDIYRKKLSKAYIYFSTEPKIRRRQLLFRQDLESEIQPSSDRTATILFVSLLDEHQRRLYAGLESLKLGYGGNKKVASYLRLDVHTVAQGKQELVERTYKEQGNRQAGAGRNSIKKSPLIIIKLEELLAHETAGDPITGLKWTGKTIQKIAHELQSSTLK